MKSFLENAGKIFLAIFLALGWKWADLLKDGGYINDKVRLLIVITSTVLLFLQQAYLALPNPEKRSIVEQRNGIIKPYLADFLKEYYRILESENISRRKKDYPVVRVNVMLSTMRLKGIGGNYLQMYYVTCPKGVVYSADEMTLKWYKGDGTCGWAWKDKRVSTFDSRNADLKLPSKRMKDFQMTVVKKIKSALSIPIWYGNSVVGVLNLDSKKNINDTLFTDEKVYTLAVACASVLSGQCFRDGVEG